MIQRYTAQTFNCDFPEALLEGMNANELVAWMTEREGIYSIVCNIGDTFNYTAMEKAGWQAIKNYRLFIDDDDELLILPYSQYTFACDQNKGQVEIFEGLSGSMAIAKGWYQVDIVGNLSGNEEISGEFMIFLSPVVLMLEKQTDTDIPRF